VKATIKGRLILRYGQSDANGQLTGYRWFTTEPTQVEVECDLPWYRDHPEHFEVVGIEHEVKE
jgi:hypothetical protein